MDAQVCERARMPMVSVYLRMIRLRYVIRFLKYAPGTLKTLVHNNFSRHENLAFNNHEIEKASWLHCMS